MYKTGRTVAVGFKESMRILFDEVLGGLMKIGGLRTFFLPVNLRVFVPFWVLGKDRSVLLACFLHAILGYPLIPLIKTVHSHGRRSALYQPTP